ncbi:MAG: LysR family transcriptional regulator [Pseudomonadota bacterium]
MTWDDYRIILALHREGSLRAAAKSLGVNHSTVSRRLAALDQDIFEKAPAGYRITSVKGHALLEASQAMETAILSAERKARAGSEQVAGHVTLSIPDAFGQFLLLDDFMRFRAVHPDIKLTIKTSYSFADLDRSEADIAVRVTQNPPDHLVGRRLFPYYVAHYAGVDYLENTRPEDRVWITLSDGDKTPDWIARSPFPDAPVSFAMEDATMRHRAAAAGHGMISGACYMDDPNPALMRVPGTVPQPRQDIWVLTHPDLRETPRIKLVMGFLVNAIVAKRDLIEGRQPQSGK